MIVEKLEEIPQEENGLVQRVQGYTMKHFNDAEMAERLMPFGINEDGTNTIHCSDTSLWYVFTPQKGGYKSDRKGIAPSKLLMKKAKVKVKEGVKLIDEIEESSMEENDKKDLTSLIAKSIACYRRYLNSSKLKNLISMIEIRNSFEADKLNLLRHIAIFENGALNLRTGEFITDNRKIAEFYDTHQIPYNFNQDATCPNFLKFIDEITGGDQELAEYLNVLLGYFLTGETGEQAIWFWYGSGSNGKGTLVDVLMAVLGVGEYAIQMRTEALLEVAKNSDASAANPEIAKLEGHRLAVASEGREGTVMNLPLMKQVVGENLISARHLYGNPRTFQLVVKLLVDTNHLPCIKETDHGTWRRIKVVPFEVTFPLEKLDKNLKSKLKAEGEGILAWMVRGAAKYYQLGRIPDSIAVQRATLEYRLDSDMFDKFLNHHTKSEMGASVSNQELHGLYGQWAKANNAPELSNVAFPKEMESRGYRKVRRGSGNFYLGIRELNQAEKDMPF